jgi:hypothetical protein
VGDSESEGFWNEFFASLIAAGFCEAVARGLTDVKLVMSGAPPHQGHPQAAAGLCMAALSRPFR